MLGLQFLFGFLELFLFVSRERFLLRFLGLEVFEHRTEVAELERRDGGAVALEMNELLDDVIRDAE